MASSSYNTHPVVIFDNGSYTSKIGYAGMEDPSMILASAVGTKRNHGTTKTTTITTTLTSTTAAAAVATNGMSYLVDSHDVLLEHASTHDFNFMIRHGLIQDWDAMEQFWQSCIYEKLRCNPEEHCFLITESPYNAPESREQMAEIMFETYNIPGMFIAAQPILALAASWGSVDSRQQELSGTVVDSGDSTTTIIPVAEGRVLRSGIQQIQLGGRDITSYVQDRLRKNKRNVPPSQSFEVARRIKEKYGYVCSNIEKERAKGKKQTIVGGGQYHVNDDVWECTVDEETFLSGEVLFEPKLLNGSKSQLCSVPDLVDTTIQECPIDIRRMLYGNIVLSGGSTMFPDFGRRLQRDLKRVVNTRLQKGRTDANLGNCQSESLVEVNVVSHQSQNNAAWLGGSIVASDPRFPDWVKTKKQYDEEGPRIFRSSTGIFYSSYE